MKISLLTLLLLLHSVAALSADYTEALDKAKQAAMIQTGIQAKIDLAKNWGTNTATHYIRNIGIDKEVGAALYSYRVYRDKCVSLPISSSGDRLILKMDSANVQIHF